MSLQLQSNSENEALEISLLSGRELNDRRIPLMSGYILYEDNYTVDFNDI